MQIIEEYSDSEFSEPDYEDESNMEHKTKRQAGDIQPKGIGDDIAAFETIAKILVTIGQDVIPILLDTVNNRQLEGPLVRVLKGSSSYRLRNILDG